MVKRALDCTLSSHGQGIRYQKTHIPEYSQDADDWQKRMEAECNEHYDPSTDLRQFVESTHKKWLAAHKCQKIVVATPIDGPLQAAEAMPPAPPSASEAQRFLERLGFGSD
jgi:hypothetical protein